MGVSMAEVRVYLKNYKSKLPNQPYVKLCQTVPNHDFLNSQTDLKSSLKNKVVLNQKNEGCLPNESFKVQIKIANPTIYLMPTINWTEQN